MAQLSITAPKRERADLVFRAIKTGAPMNDNNIVNYGVFEIF